MDESASIDSERERGGTERRGTLETLGQEVSSTERRGFSGCYVQTHAVRTAEFLTAENLTFINANVQCAKYIFQVTLDRMRNRNQFSVEVEGTSISGPNGTTAHIGGMRGCGLDQSERW